MLFFTKADVAAHLELAWPNGKGAATFFADKQASRAQLAYLRTFGCSSCQLTLTLQHQLQQVLVAAAAGGGAAAPGSVARDSAQLLEQLEQLFTEQHERQRLSSLALLQDLLSKPPPAATGAAQHGG